MSDRRAQARPRNGGQVNEPDAGGELGLPYIYTNVKIYIFRYRYIYKCTYTHIYIHMSDRRA